MSESSLENIDKLLLLNVHVLIIICVYYSDILRAKEYERERRLLVRERRKQRAMEAVTA